MAERPIATVCKTVARKGSAGSNPAPSTCPGGSVAERVLGKDEVAGSIPALGSNINRPQILLFPIASIFFGC